MRESDMQSYRCYIQPLLGGLSPEERWKSLTTARANHAEAKGSYRHAAEDAPSGRP
jgi:hypothetical protein